MILWVIMALIVFGGIGVLAVLVGGLHRALWNKRNYGFFFGPVYEIELEEKEEKEE